MTVLLPRRSRAAAGRPAPGCRPAARPGPRGAFRTARAGAAVLLALTLAGCGGGDSDPADPPTTTPTTTTTGEPTMDPHDDPTTLAVNDLASRLDLTPEDVTVVGTEEVDWRDGSLGCAQKGMSYTQAIVPGLRITLKADGREYAYHQGRSKAPFLCENPTQ
ncbi:MAG: hypothetical protein ACI379_07905 [Nocardioides sp.]|uniref:hypothetical protein n=1 Tax=Nocardioides sp. TaxID=35761 RepID=UPI003F113E3D